MIHMTLTKSPDGRLGQYDPITKTGVVYLRQVAKEVKQVVVRKDWLARRVYWRILIDWVTFHEHAHAVQHAMGRPFDELQADQSAHSRFREKHGFDAEAILDIKGRRCSAQ